MKLSLSVRHHQHILSVDNPHEEIPVIPEVDCHAYQASPPHVKRFYLHNHDLACDAALFCVSSLVCLFFFISLFRLHLQQEFTTLILTVMAVSVWIFSDHSGLLHLLFLKVWKLMKKHFEVFFNVKPVDFSDNNKHYSSLTNE